MKAQGTNMYFLNLSFTLSTQFKGYFYKHFMIKADHSESRKYFFKIQVSFWGLRMTWQVHNFHQYISISFL